MEENTYVDITLIRGFMVILKNKFPFEVDRFFQDVKVLSTSPPGETLSCVFSGLKISRFY
jgi:hypothetical protein